MRISYLLVAIAFVLGLTAGLAHAHSHDKSGEEVKTVEQHCGSLIRNCFVNESTSLTKCLYSSGTHPFCKGTMNGQLALERWSMSPSRAQGGDAPPALLGPQLVDLECLSNFDNQWSAMLIAETASELTTDRLQQKLKECARDISPELSRP